MKRRVGVAVQAGAPCEAVSPVGIRFGAGVGVICK